ncbi:MAG: hypothetical protein KF912_04650 [Phycisphaeraceae bacterium]|nr:hypothetical protein [Phycisphaeraceae bacterium]
MRSICTGAVLAAAAMFGGTATAGTVATVIIEGQSYEMASFMVDGQFRLVPAVYTFGSTTVEALETPRDASAAMAYGIAVTDFGAPSSFSFSFSMPITLDPGATSISSSIVGGMTDFTGNGVGVFTTGGNATLQRSHVSMPDFNLGVDVGGDQSYGPGLAGSHYTYGPVATGPVVGPDLSGYGTLTMYLDFAASGDGDVIVLTGFTEIIVPAPASLALLGGLGLIARRRR